MVGSHGAGIGLVDPAEAWDALADPRSLLVDVRTRAEWTFVGLPDSPDPRRLVLLEWLGFPGMAPNPRFLDDLTKAVAETGAESVYFLCRSGGRSHDAALAARSAVEAAGRPVACFNVLEGFEGDLDGEGRRGRVNGWKARGLPWRQS